MPLIKCPECTHSVSDTADNCPNCVYSIRQYLENKKAKEIIENKKTEEKKKINNEKAKLHPELETKLNEIDAIKRPSLSPVLFFIEQFLLSLLFTAISIGVICLSVWVGGITLVILGGVGLLFLILSLIALFYTGKSTEAYKEKINDFEAWKKQEKKKIVLKYDEYAINLAKYGQREKPIEKINTMDSSIKCPVCGSKNVKALSTLNRSVSVAAFGLASSKIGKQYECKSCNHKW